MFHKELLNVFFYDNFQSYEKVNDFKFCIYSKIKTYRKHISDHNEQKQQTVVVKLAKSKLYEPHYCRKNCLKKLENRLKNYGRKSSGNLP